MTVAAPPCVDVSLGAGGGTESEVAKKGVQHLGLVEPGWTTIDAGVKTFITYWKGQPSYLSVAVSSHHFISQQCKLFCNLGFCLSQVSMNDGTYAMKIENQLLDKTRNSEWR